METPPASVAPVGGHLQAALGEPRPKKAGILTSENSGGVWNQAFYDHVTLW